MLDIEIKPYESLSNVYWIKYEDGRDRLATINLTPGESVYGEELIQYKGREYRIWDPYRSKFAASIIKKIKYIPISHGDMVLYLGAASGTTASHVSDIVGKNGKIFCVEFSQRVMRELIEKTCIKRSNVYPILVDARFPEKYKIVSGPVDVIYCDIAQPEQAKVLINNSKLFLKEKGGTLFSIKSRSINVVQDPKDVIQHEVEILKENGFVIQDIIRLDPFDKDHAMVTAIYKRK